MKFTDQEKCRLCVSLGNSDLTCLLEQVKLAAPWADLIEIRLDKLPHFDAADLLLIKKNACCPIIWTLRKASHGGEFHGNEEERISLLRLLISTCQADFIDLEADTPLAVIDELQHLSPQTQWIISWHDLKETPEDLEALFQRISHIPAHYYKIATFARSTLDAIRMLKLTQAINRSESRLCGLCMGQLGQATRILSPLVGQPFTFAALDKGIETAAGQLTAEELICTYRFREMNKNFEVLGLIGRPVDKSYSHITHNAVLRKCQLLNHARYNAVYLKFFLQDEELFPFFDAIQSLPIKGMSATMPFKEKILPLLKEKHDLSACNTLVRSSQGWQGCNTDGIGTLKALGLSTLKNQKIVILGGGGTAKAIASAAYSQGLELAILNRTVARAQAIAYPLKAKWGPLDNLPALIQEGYTCIIQATPIGMAPALNETLIPSDWIPLHAIVLDVISNPAETLFLRELKSRGVRTVSGQELFIHQAVEQFIYWFGESIPRSEIELTIRSYL